MSDDAIAGKRARDQESEPQPAAKLHRTVPSISEMWKSFAPALEGDERSAFSTAIQWLTGVAQNGTEAERLELCSLLAPIVSKLLQQRDTATLEEATRALRWLLIEPEDPACQCPGTTQALPSKTRDLFLRTPGLVDAVVSAFAYVVTPPIESRLETVKEVLSLVVCLCKVEALAKALWDQGMVPAIAKLCYAQHRKVVIRACWALTKITKTLNNFADMAKVALQALFAAMHQRDEEIAFAAISALQSMFPSDEANMRPFEEERVIERLVVLARPPTNPGLRQRAVLLLASMASVTKQEDWYASLGCLSVFLEAVNETPDPSHKNCMCRAGLCGLAGLMKPDKNRIRPPLIRMTMNFESLASCLTSASAPCRRDARIMLQWLFRPFNMKTMLELVATGLVPKIFDLQTPEAREWLEPNMKKTMDAVYPVLDLPANRALQLRALLTCLCYEGVHKDRSSLEELLIRRNGLKILFTHVHYLAHEGKPPQDEYEAHAGLRYMFQHLATHPIMELPPEPPAPVQSAEFNDLVNNPNMHDAEFELDDGSVYYAHRVFLVKRSEFFDKMFRSPMMESSKMRIKLGEIKGPVLLQLLRWLYCKTVSIASVEEALAVIAAGSKFIVQGIELPCLVFLRDRITASTIAETIEFGHLHSSPGLIDLCMSWIVRKYGELHMTSEMTALFKDVEFVDELHKWIDQMLKVYIRCAPPPPLAAPAPR